MQPLMRVYVQLYVDTFGTEAIREFPAPGIWHADRSAILCRCKPSVADVYDWAEFLGHGVLHST
jgi:hypothetical protein